LEFLVAVDDVVAFVGGIDICYGRYDNSEYPITDPDGRLFPGSIERFVSTLTYFKI
jgi:hypothetical protein